MKIAALLVLLVPTFACAQWSEMERVLTHPRCLNCHTMTEYPTQGDNRHRHQYRIVRGGDDNGAPGTPCSYCHWSANRPEGFPGAPSWHIAPRALAWESRPGVPMRGAELCRTLVERTKGLDRLPEFLAKEPLVAWAWNPGIDITGRGRTTPPISHAEFVEATRRWIAEGAPCPE